MEKKPAEPEPEPRREATPVPGSQPTGDREVWISAREDAAKMRDAAADAREATLATREALARLRDEALRARSEADQIRADREHLLAQTRDANEKLVLATLRAEELAEEAIAARMIAAEGVQALRESEARYRALFESIDEGFCVIEILSDDDGNPCDFRYEEVNPAFEAHTGLHEAVGKRIRELAPDIEAHWAERYGHVLATGEPTRFVNEAKPLGRWFEIYAFRIGVPERRRVACLFTDVTGRKQADAQVQATSRAKDEFLAMLGHELRNPLAPIVTALGLMALRDPTGAEQERAIIERQVNHLMRLVDDLLDVSRIASGKVELRREPIELAAIVSLAVEIASPLFEKKFHNLIVEVPPRGLVVDGDVGRLAQVVANLLTNAAKYTPAKGTITVTAERLGPRIFLRVRDTGIGISAEMLPRVFELFAQERQALDRAQGCLGLGLAIVQNLLAMHGGSVTAHSDGVGRGSEFGIDLPASNVLYDAPRDRAVAGGATPRTTGSARVYKILVVDDNEDVAELTAVFLAKFGHEVRFAFDGPEAIKVVADFVPDIALLDIGLPGMDGYELAGRLRTMLAPQDVQFIAITGYGQTMERNLSDEAGFALHLVKPIDIATLRRSIDSIMAAPR